MNKYLYEDLYQQEETHWWHVTKTNAVLNLISKYQKAKDLKILDIGCGAGKNAETFTKLGKSWGIDSSTEAIKFCKRRGLKNIYLAKSDKLPFKNDFFNVVTLLDVLEHVEEKSTLSEINRVLAPNGILVINVPAFPWLWSKWDEVLHHRRRYTRKSLEKVLSQNGLKIKKISYTYSFLVLPAYLIRLVKSKLSQKHYSSDFAMSSKLENRLLIYISTAERMFWTKFYLPFGTSLIAVAQKQRR